jgi:hypothetical protein
VIHTGARKRRFEQWEPIHAGRGLSEEAHRQALLLRGAPEEAEALDFIKAAADTRESAT